LYLYLETLKYYETQKEYDKTAECLNLLSGIYRQQKLPYKIIENCNRIISFQDKIRNPAIIGRMYRQLSIAYHNLKPRQLDKGLIFAKEALSVFENIQDKKGISYSLNLVGLTFSRMGKLPEAMPYYQAALTTFQETKNYYMEAAVLDNIGDIFMKQNQLEEAETYYAQSLAVAKIAQSPLRALEVYESRVKLYQQQQDYQQIVDNQALIIELKDSLVNEENVRQLMQMEVLHDVRQKNAQIAHQNIALEQAQRERKYSIDIFNWIRDVLGMAKKCSR